MSLILPSSAAPTSAASPASSASPTARRDEQGQNAPGSFGDALARSLQPAAEKAEKTEKVAAKAPSPSKPSTPRDPADKAEPDAKDLVNVLGLPFLPVEARPVKAALTTAIEAPAATGVLPGAATSLLAGALADAGNTEPEALAASMIGRGSALPAPVTALPDAVLAGTPAPASAAAAALQASSQASLQAKRNTALAPGHQDDAGQGRLQAGPAAATQDAAVVLADAHISRQLGAPGRGTPQPSAKPDDKVTRKLNESIKAGAEIMPATHAPADAPASSGTVLPVNMVSTAAQGQPGLAAANDPAPAATGSLAPQVGSDEWSKALGQQVAQMGKAGHQVTELQLNPPGLGPLKVTLSMSDQQMHAVFVSAHSSVRAAVEAALPQLRSTLADSGISLGQTSVGAQSQQQTAFANGQDGAPHRGTAYAGEAANTRSGLPARAVTEPARRVGGREIDIYA